MKLSEPTRVRAPNPVLKMLGRGLESALNHALTLDPDTQADLRPLDGRALSFTFKGTGMAMRLRVDGERLSVGPAFDGESQLRVSATPGSLIGLAFARLGGGEATAMAPGQVEISGDAELARRLERLASRFQPDIDEVFSRTFGDVLGFQIAKRFRRGIGALRESAASLARDTVDYLVEERRDLIAKPEMEQFLDDVDNLREHADRFAARVERLASAQRG